MTPASHWPWLTARALLVAPGTPLPAEWRLDDDCTAGGWSRVVSTFDRLQLEKETENAGWRFFFMAGTVTSCAAGFSGPGRVDSALKRLIAKATREKCNSVEIDGVAMRSFLGLPYVSITAHLRHIQKGLVFSGH